MADQDERQPKADGLSEADPQLRKWIGVGVGVGAGIGSAAIAAALLYASRSNRKKSGGAK